MVQAPHGTISFRYMYIQLQDQVTSTVSACIHTSIEQFLPAIQSLGQGYHIATPAIVQHVRYHSDTMDHLAILTTRLFLMNGTREKITRNAMTCGWQSCSAELLVWFGFRSSSQQSRGTTGAMLPVRFCMLWLAEQSSQALPCSIVAPGVDRRPSPPRTIC